MAETEIYYRWNLGDTLVSDSDELRDSAHGGRFASSDNAKYHGDHFQQRYGRYQSYILGYSLTIEKVTIETVE